MTEHQLKLKQEDLDKELITCPKCGQSSTWGVIREMGTCLECYRKYTENKKK